MGGREGAARDIDGYGGGRAQLRREGGQPAPAVLLRVRGGGRGGHIASGDGAGGGQRESAKDDRDGAMRRRKEGTERQIFFFDKGTERQVPMGQSDSRSAGWWVRACGPARDFFSTQ